MRIAFAGTPEFGARVLAELLAIGRRPVLVLSQPPRPQGRGRRVGEAPVATVARAAELPLLMPEDINAPDVISALTAARVDCLVVAAFGQLFRPALLDAVCCVNVHASLLPAYRGAAPIHWALRNGEEATGVSIMRVVQPVDAGPVAARVSVSINPWDDGGSLARALATLGALALDKVLTAMEDGTVSWEEQPEQGTYAPKVTAADRALDLTRDARMCHNLVRSLVPDAAAEVRAGSLTLRVWRAWPWLDADDQRLPAEARGAWSRPGLIARSGGARGRLFLGCGEGVLEVLAVQPAGRTIMGPAEFLRGYGSRLPDAVTVQGG